MVRPYRCKNKQLDDLVGKSWYLLQIGKLAQWQSITHGYLGEGREFESLTYLHYKLKNSSYEKGSDKNYRGLGREPC